MRNLFTVITLLTLSFFTNSYAQCSTNPNDEICRGVLGGLIFELLYENNTNVLSYQAAYYPTPYIDLQEITDLNLKLKVLSYLQFDNGFSVFDYSLNPSYCFKLESEVTRIEATIFIMEAWDIPPDYNGSSPFDDIDNDDPIFGYANRAYDEDFIDISNGDFDPYESITVGEVLDFLVEVLDSSYHPVNENLNNSNNYFEPGIYDPFNLGRSRGIDQAVFNHYAKDSFKIPDVKMNLSFSHFYSTTMVEMPTGFYKFKPLGSGWSHTYNSYIIKENNVGEDNIDYYFIVWPDGTIHSYDEDDNEYVSVGVYDDLDEFPGDDEIRIRKKNQVDYYFGQLDDDEQIWYLIRIEDPNGNTLEISYQNSALDSDLMRITNVRAPSGKELDFQYESGTDYLKRIVDPIGRVIEFDLDLNNDERLESFFDAKGNETRYKYIENDQDAPLADQRKRFLLDEIILPRGNKIIAEYDEDDAKLEQYRINNEFPIEVEIDFDFQNNSEFSTVSRQINGEDFTEDFEFNLNGLIEEYSSDANNLSFEYPNGGVNVTMPTDSNMNGINIEYDYDNQGNITEINKEGISIERFDYDNDNNLTEYIDPEGNVTTFEYDGDENLVQINHPIGNPTIFSYYGNGLLLSKINPEGVAVNYTYEDDGVVSQMNAPEGIFGTYMYDGVNRLLQQNLSGSISSFTYDENDNMTSFINSGNVATIYDYDENDNVSSILNGNSTLTTFTYDDKDRLTQEFFGELINTFQYNNEGLLYQNIKPSGEVITYEYDDEGRLEETGTIIDFDYNSRNLVEEVANNEVRYAFEYDNLNRLDEVEDQFSDVFIRYDYDDVGNIIEIEYGNNLEVFYFYDGKNRLDQIEYRLNGGDTKFLLAYTYRDDDRIDSISYYNELIMHFNYDEAGRLTEKLLGDTTTGNILYKQEISINAKNNVIGTTAQYLVDKPIEPTFPQQNNLNYSYDENNHIEGDFFVNDDGELLQDPFYNFEYDADGRIETQLGQNDVFEYKYDPYGNRVSKTKNSNESRYVWDLVNNNVLTESIADQDPSSYYIYGLGLEAELNQNGAIKIYHGDHRGNVVLITNEDRTAHRRYSYNDFGKVRNVGPGHNPDETRFTFMGKYGVQMDDKENGYYYVKARYYDAKMGRFLTEDPVWSTNLYPYANNNPLSYIDPNGRLGLLVVYNWYVDSLTEEFIYRGYGEAAVVLSNESETWDYAISNPKTTGLIIGVGAGVAAQGIAGAIIGSNAFTSALSFKSGVEAITVTEDLLNLLGSTQNISREDYNKNAFEFFNVYGPALVETLGSKGEAAALAYSLLTIFLSGN